MEKTDIALSSSAKASKLKYGMLDSNTQPSMSRCDTNHEKAMGNGSHGKSLQTIRAPVVNGRAICDVVCTVLNPLPTLETFS